MSIVDLETVRGLYKKAGASRFELDIAPRFKPGDAVVARSVEPAGHTRLAGYVQGKSGVVERDHGVFHLPDSRVAGQGDRPQHIYSVRFSARDLWGPETPAKDSLNIDLWDDYLEPA